MSGELWRGYKKSNFSLGPGQTHAGRTYSAADGFGLEQNEKELQYPAKDQLCPHICTLCYFQSHISSANSWEMRKEGTKEQRSGDCSGDFSTGQEVGPTSVDCRHSPTCEKLAPKGGSSGIGGQIRLSGDLSTADIKRNLDLLRAQMLRCLCACYPPSVYHHEAAFDT